MKQKFLNRNKLLLTLLLGLLSITTISCENIKNQEKELNKRLRADDYYERPMIIPRSHFHHNDHVHVQQRNLNFPQQERPQILPLMTNAPQNIYQQVDACPCINEVKCPPCGIVFEPATICPCAPKPSCPVCPPLSLIHEIAAKKV